MAYFSIWNEYYRDETLQAKVEIDDAIYPNLASSGGSLKQRCWEKDYFTSALPWQQRGTAPSLPISGTTQAIFDFGPGGIGALPVNYNFSGTNYSLNGQ